MRNVKDSLELISSSILYILARILRFDSVYFFHLGTISINLCKITSITILIRTLNVRSNVPVALQAYTAVERSFQFVTLMWHFVFTRSD